MACPPLTVDSTAHTVDTTSITVDATEFCSGPAPFDPAYSISFVSAAERPVRRKRRKRLDYALLLLS